MPLDACHQVKNGAAGRTVLGEHSTQMCKRINTTDSCRQHQNARSLTSAVGESKASVDSNNSQLQHASQNQLCPPYYSPDSQSCVVLGTILSNDGFCKRNKTLSPRAGRSDPPSLCPTTHRTQKCRPGLDSNSQGPKRPARFHADKYY